MFYKILIFMNGYYRDFSNDSHFLGVNIIMIYLY